jgi:CheY-like chemotaxis protein
MNIGLREKRKTILLVDADPHARAVMRNALEAAGFTVGEAASVESRENVRRFGSSQMRCLPTLCW